MSVIVVKKTTVKDGDKSIDKFIMGCDTQTTLGQTKGQVTKIFKNKLDDRIVCGVVGSLRDLNLVSTITDIIEQFSIRRDVVDTETIITKTIRTIKDTLGKEGRIMATDRGEIMSSSIALAFKDKAWIIGPDFAVKEILDFEAIGGPQEFAIGAYEAIKDDDMPDEDKVVKIIDICIRRTIYVDYPICITDTATGSVIKEITKEVK